MRFRGRVQLFRFAILLVVASPLPPQSAGTNPDFQGLLYESLFSAADAEFRIAKLDPSTFAALFPILSELQNF